MNSKYASVRWFKLFICLEIQLMKYGKQICFRIPNMVILENPPKDEILGHRGAQKRVEEKVFRLCMKVLLTIDHWKKKP